MSNPNEGPTRRAPPNKSRIVKWARGVGATMAVVGGITSGVALAHDRFSDVKTFSGLLITAGVLLVGWAELRRQRKPVQATTRHRVSESEDVIEPNQQEPRRASSPEAASTKWLRRVGVTTVGIGGFLAVVGVALDRYDNFESFAVRLIFVGTILWAWAHFRGGRRS